MSIQRTDRGTPVRVLCDHDGCDAAYGIIRFLNEWGKAGWGFVAIAGDGVAHVYHYCEKHIKEHQKGD